MVDIQKVFQYFGKYSKFTNLPSYEELNSGLEEITDKGLKDLDGMAKIVTVLGIPENELENRTDLVKKVASHLWGGENFTPDVFQNLDVESIERFEYATREPLRIEVKLPGNVKKAVLQPDRVMLSSKTRSHICRYLHVVLDLVLV